ncbi:MAG: hypothetical protein AB1489_10350 [Acidobacteriota bacterium]
MNSTKYMMWLIIILMTLMSAFACKRLHPPEPKSSPSTIPSAELPYSPIFQPILNWIKRESNVPLQLPKAIPNVGQDSKPIYAVVKEIRSDSYTISLDLTPNCNGKIDCHIDMIKAETISRKWKLRGQVVRLTPEITGHFVEARCRSNCPDSRLNWRQGNTLYSFGLKNGHLTDLLEMARSAITTGVL